MTVTWRQVAHVQTPRSMSMTMRSWYGQYLNIQWADQCISSVYLQYTVRRTVLIVNRHSFHGFDGEDEQNNGEFYKGPSTILRSFQKMDIVSLKNVSMVFPRATFLFLKHHYT